MTTCQDTTAADTRSAITRTAAALFVRRGYDATSMDLIATEAQVARQTIYNQFESKEALFRAIVAALADEAVMPLAAPTRKGASARPTLLRVARSILATALRPSTLAVHRLVVAEAARFPELGQAIYASGAARAVAQLAEFLREQHQSGHLDAPHPETAAEQFFGMVISFQQFRALMGIKLLPSEIEAAAREAVASFLRAFGRKPQGRRSSREVGRK
jgi:TetR/AcrR family transcriptional regulator, mexJK operon transcriptional repressor